MPSTHRQMGCRTVAACAPCNMTDRTLSPPHPVGASDLQPLTVFPNVTHNGLQTRHNKAHAGHSAVIKWSSDCDPRRAGRQTGVGGNPEGDEDATGMVPPNTNEGPREASADVSHIYSRAVLWSDLIQERAAERAAFLRDLLTVCGGIFNFATGAFTPSPDGTLRLSEQMTHREAAGLLGCREEEVTVPVANVVWDDEDGTPIEVFRSVDVVRCYSGACHFRGCAACCARWTSSRG